MAMTRLHALLFVLSIFLYLGFVSCKKTSRKSPAEIEAVAVDESVIERGLVAEKTTSALILKNARSYSKETDTRRFRKSVLGYVTPWNSAGYENAKIFRSKFTHICPVWYQIRPADRTKGRYLSRLTGEHDVDMGWIEAVRGADRRGPKMVPRFMFEEFFQEGLERLLEDPQGVAQTVDLIVSECVSRKYDGIVLEIFNSLDSVHAEILRTELHNFFKALSTKLHERRMELVLVAPAQPSDTFRAEDLKALRGVVDLVSVLTYDFSSSTGAPGPVAPLPWIASSTSALLVDSDDPHRLASHVLLGVHFYGMHYRSTSGEALGPRDYLRLLREHKPKVTWDADTHEHVIKFKAAGVSHTIYYPTYKSIDDVLTLASELGAGIAIWEIGQAQESWFDLF